MALLFIDGMEHYATAGMLQKWDEQNGTSRHTVGTAYGRFGNGIQFQANSGGGYGRKNITPSATVIIGFAHRVTVLEDQTNDPVIAMMEGTGYHVEVRYATNGVFRVTRNGTTLATGTTVISASLWRYVELKATIDGTIGSYELRINGAVELTATNQNTRNGGAGVVNKVHFGLGGAADGGHATHFDDIYVLDSTGSGSVPRDFLGDVKVETLIPDGAGNYSQFTNVGGDTVFGTNRALTPSAGTATSTSTVITNAANIWDGTDASAVFAAGASARMTFSVPQTLNTVRLRQHLSMTSGKIVLSNGLEIPLITATTNPHQRDYTFTEATLSWVEIQSASGGTLYDAQLYRITVNTRWTSVDDPVADDDVTYNTSNTLGQRDSFSHGNLVMTAGTVRGIQQITRWRKDDAGVRTAKQFLRVGGADYGESTASVLSTSYANRLRPIDLNPATGNAWTIAEINALEAGYELVS